MIDLFWNILILFLNPVCKQRKTWKKQLAENSTADGHCIESTTVHLWNCHVHPTSYILWCKCTNNTTPALSWSFAVFTPGWSSELNSLDWNWNQWSFLEKVIQNYWANQSWTMKYELIYINIIFSKHLQVTKKWRWC